MTDFEAALRSKLQRNDQLAGERAEAEAEVKRVAAARQRSELERQQRTAEARAARHAELAAHLKDVAAALKASAPEQFIVRTGWTESGEEFIAKLRTRLLDPGRSLFLEIDRDDDEVLAKWSGDLGTAVEMWRLLEVTTAMLSTMVLQVADQEVWSGTRPPPFPEGAPIEVE